mmetsp:Transcript_3701/g.4260  ORF Transcript_3701/g.4260 Transcript_3701/m.4260 type:complete len:92 (-) Transcript_3701:86-361(-)
MNALAACMSSLLRLLMHSTPTSVVDGIKKGACNETSDENSKFDDARDHCFASFLNHGPSTALQWCKLWGCMEQRGLLCETRPVCVKFSYVE